MRIKIVLFFLFMLFHMGLIAQCSKVDSIYYMLPKEIDQLILTGFETFGKIVKNEEHHFYLLIDQNKSDSMIIFLTYCDSGFVYWMIKNSNRFYKMSDKTILPIVFQTDFDYGVNTTTPAPVSRNVGGYEMYVFRNKAFKGNGIVY